MAGPRANEPRLITLEGGEGAGKSTQIEAIADAVREHGHAAVVTREPGGTPLGEAVRGVLMQDYVSPPPAMSELLLMFAARAAHLSEVIEPALARGAWVISDRFTDASYAYQGAARGLGADRVALLEQLVQNDRRPDGVLLFDLACEVGLERAGARGTRNRFDRETLAFHQRVRDTYLARARAAPQRYRVIDAERSPTEVREQALDALKTWL